MEFPKAPERPNIIWIFGDQHRGQALSCAGDPNLRTPRVDQLATQGIRFPRAVAGFPLCCPFRGSLMTSRYPHRAVPGHEFPLDPELPTVATAFKDNGYHTAYFGKWHLDGFKERNGRAAHHYIEPGRRGQFDQWLGYENNNAQYDCWVHGHEADGTEIEHYRLPGYETDCLTDLLIEYIEDRSRLADESDKDQPFFAALSVQPPHDPYDAPPEFLERHNPAQLELRPNVPPVDWVEEKARRELAGYCAQIENLDWNVGRVVDTLRELGMMDNTCIVFFSDHGDQHGSHGFFRKMSPYAESVNIPFVVSGGPSRYYHHGSPRAATAPINHVDIAPTSLGLAGIDKPDWMEGTDYSGLYRRGRDVGELPDSAYMQVVVPTRHGPSVDLPWRGIQTTDGWKYVCTPGQAFMMFNLNEDPYELNNMANHMAYDEQRQRLHRRLAEWIEQTGDDFALPELPTRP